MGKLNSIDPEVVRLKGLREEFHKYRNGLAASVIVENFGYASEDVGPDVEAVPNAFTEKVAQKVLEINISPDANEQEVRKALGMLSDIMTKARHAFGKDGCNATI